MKFSELKNKNKKELEEALAEKRGELRALRFKVGSGELKKVRQLREAKKEIAKILTALRQSPK